MSKKKYHSLKKFTKSKNFKKEKSAKYLKSNITKRKKERGYKTEELIEEYSNPIQFSDSPVKLPRIQKGNPTDSKKSDFEMQNRNPQKDPKNQNLIAIMAKQIIQEEEELRAQNLIPSDESHFSEDNRGNKQIVKFQGRGSSGFKAKWEKAMTRMQNFYETYRKTLLFLFFFVLFWKIILIVFLILV